MATPTTMDELLTLDEAGRLLGVSVRQLRRWRSSNLLAFTLLGGSRRHPRIARRDLNAFVEQSRDKTSHHGRQRQGRRTRQ